MNELCQVLNCGIELLPLQPSPINYQGISGGLGPDLWNFCSFLRSVFREEFLERLPRLSSEMLDSPQSKDLILKVNLDQQGGICPLNTLDYTGA